MKRLLFSFFIVSFLFYACSHYDDIMKNGKESTSNESSHHTGENCMNCHNKGEFDEASREAWWNVAGSVWGGKAKKVELWSEPNRNGNLIYTLTVDNSGNFYTSKIIDFKSGVYPSVVANDGSHKNMQSKIITGSCNSCHGLITPKIELN
jgi:hypothetical protein